MSTDNNIPEPSNGSSPHAGNGADQPVAGLPVRADYPRSMTVGWPVAGAEWTEAAPSEGVITFSGFLHALRRRWPLATGLGLAVATLVAGTLWWLVPVNYEAVSLLEVKRSWYAPYTQKTQGSKSDKEFEIFKSTQMAYIKSQNVLRRALRTPEIRSFSMVKRERAPVSWLAEELDVSFPMEGNLLRISLKGENRDHVITLLKKVTQEYQQVLHFDTTESRQLNLDGLALRLRSEDQNLANRRLELHKLQTTLQALTTPGAQAKMTREQVRLSDMNRRRDRMEQDIQTTRRGIGVTSQLRAGAQQFKFTNAEIEAYLTRNAAFYPEFMAANEAVAVQGQRQALTGQHARDNSRAQARNVGQSMAAESNLKIVIRKLRPVVERALRDELGGDDNQSQIALLALDTELKNLMMDYGRLTAQIDTQQETVDLIGGDNAKLGDLRYSVEQLEERVAMTQSEIDSLEADTEAKRRVRLVQDSLTVEGETDAWFKYTIVSISSLASFGLVIFGIAIWDYRGKRVNTTTDVAAGVGLRIVGSLPALNGHRFGGWPFGRRDQRWLKSAVDDSIDAIRTALMHGNGSSPTKVVMVTSATGQEGKTTVASQLAVSLARAGRRTLLIDGDMRNPRQHLVYGVPLDHGLSELLREETDLDDVVQETAAPGLWIISAGLCDPRSIQALSRDSLHKIFQILRGRFDYIVIDSGSALANADPLLIGQYADAAVVSVRRDVSQLPKIYEACERLRSVGIYVMGAVVNGAEPETRYYGSQVTRIESADDDEAVVEEPV